MITGTWTLVVVGAIALALVAFGARVLKTGRAPAGIIRNFRSVREAGLYHLMFGVAMAVLVAGTKLPGRSTGLVAGIVAVVIAGIAIVKFRPRRTEDHGEANRHQ